jgi:site-specific recombinase XerD
LAAKPKRRRPPEILTPGEVSRLLRQCASSTPAGIRNRALITVMYRAGLRVDEALALKPSDVNPERGTILVRHGKGDRARTVAIDDGAIAIVQRWMDMRAELSARQRQKTGTRFPPNGPLFCTFSPPSPGGRMSPVYVRNMLHRIADDEHAAIGKNVRPHGLRHSHAFELAEEGVPVNVIQQQLGHSHLATTDTYLRHVAPAAVIEMGRHRPAWNPEGD